MKSAIILLSLLAAANAKDISVVYLENGDYECFEKCTGPATSCPKVNCPSEWKEEQTFEANPVKGQFPGMMGPTGGVMNPMEMGMMGPMGGMGGFPGMMGGYPGMNGFPGMMGNPQSGMSGPQTSNACGCINTCRPCMWWPCQPCNNPCPPCSPPTTTPIPTLPPTTAPPVTLPPQTTAPQEVTSPPSSNCPCQPICMPCLPWFPCNPCQCPCSPTPTTQSTTTTPFPTLPPVTQPPETTQPQEVTEPPSDCRPCAPCMPCLIWWMCMPCNNQCNNGCQTQAPVPQPPANENNCPCICAPCQPWQPCNPCPSNCPCT